MEVDNVTGSSIWASRYEYVDDWYLMRNPLLTLSIASLYLLFVLKLGPAYMRDKQPYQLTNVLLVYNIFQIVTSMYIFTYGALELSEIGLFETTTCILKSKVWLPKHLWGHYLYFLAKLTELLDTIFFVFRKKWNQVSFLHVYHHTLMFTCSWLTLKYETSFTLIILGTVNSFVHIVMYSYYLLAAFPNLKKYLWWKKYITKMQLIQFVGVMLHIQINTLITQCPISYFLLTMCWLHFFLFMYLFGKFYVQNYTQRNNAQKKMERQEKNKTQKNVASEAQKIKGEKIR